MAQDAELKLKVSLDLAFFRQQLSTIGTQLGGQALQVNVKFDKKSIEDQYRQLDRYLGRKTFKTKIESPTLDVLVTKVEKLKENLGKLAGQKISLDVKVASNIDDVRKSIKDKLPAIGIKTELAEPVNVDDFIRDVAKKVDDQVKRSYAAGGVPIATKLTLPGLTDPLKALQKNLNQKDPLRAKLGTVASIKKTDVTALQAAVNEKFKDITVKVRAELDTAAAATQGPAVGSSRTFLQTLKDLDKAVLQSVYRAAGEDALLAFDEGIINNKTKMIQALSRAAEDASAGFIAALKNKKSALFKAAGEYGGALLGGLKKTLKIQSPSREMFDIGDDAGKGFELGLLKAMELAEKSATNQMRRMLDRLARMALMMGGMSAEQINRQVAQARALPGLDFPATVPPRQRIPIGPSSTGRTLPAGRAAAGLIGAAQGPAGLLPSMTKQSELTMGLEALVQALVSQSRGRGPEGPGAIVSMESGFIPAMRERFAKAAERYLFGVETQVVDLFDAALRQVESAVDLHIARIQGQISQRMRSAVSVADLGVQGRPMLPGAITGRTPLMLPPAAREPAPMEPQMRISGGYNRPAPLEARPFYMAPGFASVTRRIPGSAGRMARGTAKPKMVGQEIPQGPSGGGPEEAAFVKAAQNALKFGLATDIAKKSVDNFRASQLPLIGGLREIGSEFGFAIKQVLLFGTAYKALAFVESLPGQILNAAKSQQQYNNALQTATQDTGTFAKELLYVDNVQRAFGLNLETTRSGFTKLYASMAPTGFDSGSIEKLFTGISAATAALQLTPDKAERVIYAFGQMASKGQIMSEELKGQLGDVLPGALAIFAKAAGMSVKEFSQAMEDGEFVGSKFRDTFAKVADELMRRFGTGAQAAGKSLQGLLNTVQGDFQRTLESFAPLANAAAQAILGPLGGSLKQLSMSAQIATGEIERTFMQLKEARKDLGDLRTGGADASQLRAAEQNVAALTARYKALQQAAQDPAIAKQAQDIQLFTQELAKAGTFVMNTAKAIGGILSPILNIFGTNLTTVISLITSFYIGFQTARLAAMALMGILLTYRALSTILGFGPATLGANALAGAFNVLGVAATGATVKTVGLTTALRVFAGTTILGAIVGGIMLIAGAFGTMRDRAQEAAQSSRDAAKAAVDAAATGNVASAQMSMQNILAQSRADKKALETLRNLRSRSTALQREGGFSVSLTPAESAALQGSELTKGMLGGIKGDRRQMQLPTTQQMQQVERDFGRVAQEQKVTLQEAKSAVTTAQQVAKDIGLNVPTPPTDKLEAETPDEAALKKAQQDAEQAAKQEQQRRIELAGLQNDMDKINFDYKMSLSDSQFEHEKQLIDELNNYELSGLNDRQARQLKFAQDLKKVQLNAIDAIRKARQKIDETQLNVLSAQRTAQAAGANANVSNNLIIGGFTPAQLSSATTAASKFTGIANMCSESVKAFYKSLGISLPGVTAWADTVRNAGTTMRDWSKLAPGDIVATGRPGDTPHVGVYTGGQNVFHQSRSRGLRAGNYPDLNYFKQGGYFVRPNAGIKQPPASFSMDTKAQKESFDLIKEQAKASAQSSLQQLEIQNALKLAYVQTASVIKANIDNIFPVEKQRLDLSLQQMRHNLLMQGMPQEYIDYEEKRAASTKEAAMAIKVMQDNLQGAKAELKVYNDAAANGTRLSIDQQANVTRLTGNIAALEEGLANAAKQQREYNIAALESTIATMKQADALKAMEEVSGRINDAVEGVTSTYKALFKEIAIGGDSVEALKKAQQALADQFLTMVFDMAMKPVEESMKNSLSKMFGVPTEKEKREESMKKMEEQLTQLKLIETNTAITAGKATASGTVPAPAAPFAPSQTTVAGGTFGIQTLPFNGQTGGMLQTLPFNGQTGGMFQNLPFSTGDTGFLSTIGINSEELSASISESANAFSEQLDKVDASVFESANALGIAGTELSKEGAAGKKWHESLGQAVNGLGMAAGAVMGIVAGINQIKEGGTSNVLGGIGMIASMAGSLLGSFGGLFRGGAGPSSIVQGKDVPIAQMPAGMQFANGGVAFGGFRAFANGGVVSGPTLGLVGEGKYNEAIVPLPDGRSIPVRFNGGRSARDVMGGNAPGMPQAPSINLKFETTKINGVEYVSKEQLEMAMAQTRTQAARDGARQGMGMTLSRLQNSPQTRRQIGM
jgi:tape measure domain-containing protein